MMTQNSHIVQQPSKNNRKDKAVLLVLSIFDLMFGIIAYFLPQAEWQIIATIASVITFVLVLRLFIVYSSERKSNVTTLILGLCDIATGVLSILVAVYTIKAIAIVATGATAFKAAKIFIQSEKAIKLTKTLEPAAQKITVKALPLIIAFIIDRINKRRKRKMDEKVEVIEEVKEKKVNAFKKLFDGIKTQLKTNPITITGSAFAAVFSAVMGWFSSYILPMLNGNIPSWAFYLSVVVISVVVFAICEIFIVVLGKDSVLSKRGKDLLKQIGLGDAVSILEAENDKRVKEAEEKAKIEKAAKAEAEKEAEENAKMLAAAEEAEAKRQAEEAEAKRQAEEAEIKNKLNLKRIEYENAKSAGQFEGTFLEWLQK